MAALFKLTKNNGFLFLITSHNLGVNGVQKQEVEYYFEKATSFDVICSKILNIYVVANVGN